MASLRLTRSNLTTIEAVINTESVDYINRRVTCAPVISETFIVSLKNRNKSIIPIHNDDRLERFKFYLLKTRNGPNSYSYDSSGLIYI